MDKKAAAPLADLFSGPPKVINLGLARFAEELAAEGAEVLQVEWSPPAGGDPKMAALLAKLGV